MSACEIPVCLLDRSKVDEVIGALGVAPISDELRAAGGY
jgi:hypothetical protein